MKKIIICTAVAALFLAPGIPAYFADESAENKTDLNDISVYEEYLEEFNKEHQSYFSMPYDEKSQDVIRSMSLDEFGKYIMSLYDGSYYDVEKAVPRYDELDIGYIMGSEGGDVKEYESPYSGVNNNQ